MDNTFLSKENLDNIYDYLNTQVVHNYNHNLNSNEKYRKIVKKLSKTIYKNLYTTVVNMTVNEFNDLVVNKSLPFIKQNLDKDLSKQKSNNQNNNVKSFNSQNIEYDNISNLNLNLSNSVKIGEDSSEKKEKKNQNRKSKKKKNDNDEYQSYLKDAMDFEKLVKDSNNKIKDNFKELLNTTQNNFVKDCNVEDTNKFTLDRCAAKDDVIEKGLSKDAFEKIVEKKTLGNNNLPQPSYPTNPSSPTQIVDSNNEAINSAVDPTKPSGYVDSYEGEDANYKKLFSQILINQKDYSKNNQVESYEGESYLPNLISNYGEEAPIQPLLYQNTKQGSELLNNHTLTIDTGTSGNAEGFFDMTSNNGATVTSTGTAKWQKFRVDLEETLSLDKIYDVYLKSFTITNAAPNTACQYFVINIDEFTFRNYSNNVNLRGKISILNTNTNGGNIFSVAHSHRANYLTTLTPINFTTLNINVTNQNNNGADDGAGNTFNTVNDDEDNPNRIIIELELIGRPKKDPIFDYTITKDTMEEVANA